MSWHFCSLERKERFETNSLSVVLDDDDSHEDACCWAIALVLGGDRAGRREQRVAFLYAFVQSALSVFA